MVCRQLGYGSAARAVIRSYFGEGGSEQLERGWDCSGSESCLEACNYLFSSCFSDDSAGVVCSLPGENMCSLAVYVVREMLSTARWHYKKQCQRNSVMFGSYISTNRSNFSNCNM